MLPFPFEGRILRVSNSSTAFPRIRGRYPGSTRILSKKQSKRLTPLQVQSILNALGTCIDLEITGFKPIIGVPCSFKTKSTP